MSTPLDLQHYPPFSADLPKACTLPKKPIKCGRTRGKYYFDPQASRCRRFTGGLCGANENSFPSKRACEKSCRKPVPLPFPPKKSGSGYPFFSDKYPLLSEKYPLLSEKYPLLSDKYPLLSDNYPWLGDEYPLLSANYPWLSDKYPLLGEKYPLLSEKYPLLSEKYPWLSDRYPVAQ